MGRNFIYFWAKLNVGKARRSHVLPPRSSVVHSILIDVVVVVGFLIVCLENNLHFVFRQAKARESPEQGGYLPKRNRVTKSASDHFSPW